MNIPTTANAVWQEHNKTNLTKFQLNFFQKDNFSFLKL